MLLIFRLPFMLVEMALRQGLGAAGTLLRLLRGGGDEPAPVVRMPQAEPAGRGAAGGGRAYTATPEAAAPPPPPSAEEAIRRRKEREAAAAPPPAEEAPPAPPTPLRSARGGDHVDREATVVESFGPGEDVHGTIQVAEPWDGYDGMPAGAVVSRLRGSDEATKAVVRLYEQQHKKRQTVLRATG